MAYSVRLTCGHTIRMATMYQGQNQGEERCPIHGAWFLVMSYTRDQWHSRCRDCQYSASHGMAKRYAETAAARHMLRKSGHRAYVAFYDATPTSEIDVLPTAPTLFDLDPDTPPPF